MAIERSVTSVIDQKVHACAHILKVYLQIQSLLF